MQTIEILNYDMAGGAKTFDPIVLTFSKKIKKVQAIFQANANDATMEIMQSENGLNFDYIKDGAGNRAIITLDATVTETYNDGTLCASATINFDGIETSYIRVVFTPVSVTAGTFKTLFIETR